MKRILSLAAILLTVFSAASAAQDRSLTRYPEYAYAGEWDTRHPDRQVLRIIKDGKVDFEYVLPLRDEWNRVLEFDDVRILPDGNILYAAMSQLGLLNRRGEHLWKYICPQGTESHSCQPLAPDLVYFALNGDPGKIVIWNTRLDKMVREIQVECQVKSSHGQFRHVRRTPEGNFVLALMQEQEILEISPAGEVLKRIPGQFAWHVDKLPDGHYLLGGDSKHYVRELDENGAIVWEVTQEDLPFPIWNLQTATRLQNGNTLICNWVAGQPEKTWAGSVQFFEITPDKQVVWQVSQWKNPDLGPCTYLDIISEPDAARGVDVLRPRHADGTPRMNNDVPNNPMGIAKGLHPGRVAWIHAPGVATWDGETGLWWEERWNDQAKARRMVKAGLRSLTGRWSIRRAWKALFVSFNESHERGDHAYRKGEKIAIKLNMNNSFAYADNEELNSSPYVTLALLESLVRKAGVRQEDITLCEPSRYLTDALYERCKAAFPHIHYVDNVGEEGREKCEFVPDAIPFTPGYGEKQYGLAKCIVEADYVINSALLKIHTGPGVTLTGKNWYGATSLDKDWHQNSHNGVNPDKRWGHAKYSSQVDFVGHKDLGGKTLLYLIDGTYGSRDCNGAPAPKWNQAPFNGDWACSLLFSQDPLAIDSVGLDLLASEWPEVGSLPYCDLYLVEAASIPETLSGVRYDPEADGVPLSEPLGLHEHWNADHQYTSIDLVYKKIR